MGTTPALRATPPDSGGEFQNPIAQSAGGEIENMDNKVIIFDTTLRDGEQAPGFSMNIEDKLKMARQLERLNVDILEAGFPIASEGDFEAVRRVSAEVRTPTIAGLARSVKKDIDRCAKALEHANKSRIHVFLATSDIHLKYKLNKSREEALASAAEGVRYARTMCDDVEFSAEDAGRTDLDFLVQVTEAVIDAGARTVNLPDTVGYCLPEDYGTLIRNLRSRVKNVDRAIISTHCHNDLGLAVANSLAGIQNGIRQVECTINGIGERAGNAALEEIVMALAGASAVFWSNDEYQREGALRFQPDALRGDRHAGAGQQGDRRRQCIRA